MPNIKKQQKALRKKIFEHGKTKALTASNILDEAKEDTLKQPLVFSRRIGLGEEKEVRSGVTKRDDNLVPSPKKEGMKKSMILFIQWLYPLDDLH